MVSSGRRNRWHQEVWRCLTSPKVSTDVSLLAFRGRRRQKAFHWSLVSCRVWNMPSNRTTSRHTWPLFFRPSCPSRIINYLLEWLYRQTHTQFVTFLNVQERCSSEVVRRSSRQADLSSGEEAHRWSLNHNHHQELQQDSDDHWTFSFLAWMFLLSILIFYFSTWNFYFSRKWTVNLWVRINVQLHV